MQTNDESRQDDLELRQVLQEWQAPPAPASLNPRVLQAQDSWWRFLIRGSVRVPVPVLCGVTLLLLFAAWRIVEPAGASTPCIVAADPGARTGPARLPNVCTSAVRGTC